VGIEEGGVEMKGGKGRDDLQVKTNGVVWQAGSFFYLQDAQRIAWTPQDQSALVV
jgi:hypothetical protein